MSAMNVIRNADGLTILNDGALYDADGVVQGFMSNLLIFPHMSAAIGVCGPLFLFPEVFAMAFQCSTFNELLSIVRSTASHLARWQREFNLVVAGYSRARDAFEVYVLPGHDGYECIGQPAFALTPVVGNVMMPGPYPAVAEQIGWDIPAPEDFDAERDGLKLMECQRRDCSSGHYVVGGFVQVTEITRAGIESRIAKWWPDEVGRMIDPERDGAMPPTRTARLEVPNIINGHHRSFTLGNLAVYKQAVVGLPKPILAQIERDFLNRAPGGATAAELASFDEVDPTTHGRPRKRKTEMSERIAEVNQDAQSIARRKALSTLALSAGLFYAGNAIFQHAFNILSRDETVDDETRAYARRFADLMADTSEDPFELRHLIGRLSPTYDNEPKSSDRVHIGYAKDGTAIYARLPTGKYGEEVIGFPTKPMTMVRQKLSPTIRGLLEIMENDKGFGRKVYDENDSSLGGDARTAFAVAKHIVMSHLPEQQITGAVDLLRGDGDSKVNAYRAFGPVIGFTASVGAPGGQARGEQLAAKQQFDARFNLAWPDIRKQVLRGDSDGAREALTSLGVPPRMQEGLIRNALNPSGALRGGTLRNFYQSATPQQIERFERAQGRGGSPVPPEMPQIEMPQ